MDKEIPDGPALSTVEVNAISPRSVVPVGKKLRSITIQVISLWAEVVVDHIQQNHHSAVMGALHQVLEVFGPPITAIGSEWVDAVVTPIALAWKVS